MSHTGEILSNEVLKDKYCRAVFRAPEICEKAEPGHFVHVMIPSMRDRILRRPFSICHAGGSQLTIVYKVVGRGTEELSRLKPGEKCDFMGPLGVPFSLPSDDEIPVIVAGGYGAAATYMISERSKNKGYLLLGARSEKDLILTDDYKHNGFDVRVATEDGAVGTKGLVTVLVKELLEENKGKNLKFYGCGPHGMLLALGELLITNEIDGELSMDQMMCCGIGACFACVVKVKDNNPDGWRYARTCKEGPVFKASDVYYGRT